MSESETISKSCETHEFSSVSEEKTCLTNEDHDIQREDGMVLCVKCGQIFNKSSQQLTNDPTQEYTLNCHSDDVKSYVANNRLFPNRFPVGKKYNTEDVEYMVFNLNLEAEVRIQAIAKYKSMIDGYFHHSTKHTKRILAAICVYTSLINERTPVTIGHICNTIGCSNSEFNKIYNQVFREFPNFRCEQMPIESLVSVTISETNIDDNEKKIICEKVKQILELERECWLIEGRTPVHIIFAATFLAWKSIKPYERRRIKLTDFCRKVNIEYKHTTSQRVTELYNAIKLLSVSAHLPQGMAINKSNIGIFLDQILEYKSSLIYDFSQRIKGISNGEKKPLTNGMTDDPNAKPSDWINVFKRSHNSESNKSEEKSTSNQNNNSDEDFSDSEIDIYLREENEIKMIKKLKKFADYCEENE